MEKQEKCYLLKDIFWICYVTKGNGKVYSVPIVYNEDRTAIKNLNTQEIVEGDFTKTTPTQIAEKLGINTPFHCTKISGECVASSIITDSLFLFLPKDLKNCTYYRPDYGRCISHNQLEKFVDRKLMTKEDLEKYSKKFERIYEKENKDIVKNAKNRIVEDSRTF